MSSDNVAIALFGYAAMGCIVGMMSLALVLDNARWCPEDGKPALAFTFGVLWPLSLVAGIGCALWLAGRMLGRSLAALWRAWRPVRVQVPRATARERR